VPIPSRVDFIPDFPRVTTWKGSANDGAVFDGKPKAVFPSKTEPAPAVTVVVKNCLRVIFLLVIRQIIIYQCTYSLL
jgi:hypothetical protein